MACPSEVDVPLPSSSNATSELHVADDCNNHQKLIFSVQIYLINLIYKDARMNPDVRNRVEKQ